MIETKDLTKTFDNFTAVDSLNLKIEKGEFFGLLGPNGAGKTTTISLLSTLLLPTKGEILIDGQQLTRQRPDLKRKISVITQEYSMRQDMNMDEIMEYQGRLYFMPRKQIKERTEELLEFCDLLKFRKRTVRKLSGGMKRKLMVCRALLTDPEILLLDEPTSVSWKEHPFLLWVHPEAGSPDLSGVPDRPSAYASFHRKAYGLYVCEKPDDPADYSLYGRSTESLQSCGTDGSWKAGGGKYSASIDRESWCLCGGRDDSRWNTESLFPYTPGSNPVSGRAYRAGVSS